MPLLEKTHIFFAQAYGSDAYGESVYSCTGTQCTTTEQSPNTGFLATTENPVGMVSLLVFIAIAVAAFSYVAIRLIKKRKAK